MKAQAIATTLRSPLPAHFRRNAFVEIKGVRFQLKRVSSDRRTVWLLPMTILDDVRSRR